jgi:ribokinase
MARFKILVVGSYVQDHCWTCDTFPVTGETRIGEFSTGPGGKGFNQAVACHRQGVPTLFIGAIGCDALGDTARRFSEAIGLTVDFEERPDSFTAASSILVDARGDNRIVVALGANARLSEDFVRARRGLFRDARVVVTQLENRIEATRAALELARESGAIALLNPAPRNPEAPADLIRLADLVTPNETEFAWLLEHLVGDTDAARRGLKAATLSDDELGALCARLNLPTIVITLGAAGAFVTHRDDAARARWGDAARWYRVDPERVATIDTTGAGDAFSGGLAAALVIGEGSPLREAVVHAGRVAALSTETRGTAPAMPTREAVAARFGGG